MKALGLRILALLLIGSIGEAVLETATAEPLHDPAAVVLWLGVGVVLGFYTPVDG